MTKKVYRTAQGQSVDLGALLLKNENVRAVGNMGVNARGDLINSKGQSIESRSQQVKKNYSRQTNTVDEPVLTRAPRPGDEVVEKDRKTKKSSNPTVDENVAAVEEPAAVPDPLESVGGLAAAIAKAREVKQTPMKTPRELAQEKAGTKKI